MNQITNNFVSQAGQMKLSVIPNDTIQALNPIVCVILGLIIQHNFTEKCIKEREPSSLSTSSPVSSLVGMTEL